MTIYHNLIRHCIRRGTTASDYISQSDSTLHKKRDNSDYISQSDSTLYKKRDNSDYISQSDSTLHTRYVLTLNMPLSSGIHTIKTILNY